MIDEPEKTCRTIEERLSAYLDEELLPGERSEVEEHLRSCRRCASTLDDLRAVIRKVRSIPAKSPPAGLRDRVLERVGAEGPKVTSRPAPPWLRLTAVGLAASFLVLLGLHLGGVIGGPREIPGLLARRSPRALETEDARDALTAAPPKADVPRAGRGRPMAPATEETPAPVKAEAREALREGDAEGDGAWGRLGAGPGEKGVYEFKGKVPGPTGTTGGELDLLRAFVEQAPKDQTIRLAWRGDAGRPPDLDGIIGRYRKAMEPKANGGGGEAARGEADADEAAGEPPAKSGAEGFMARRAVTGDLGAPEKPILLFLRREEYPRFLIELDRLEGVEVHLDEAVGKAWSDARPEVNRYLREVDKKPADLYPGKKAAGGTRDEESKDRAQGLAKEAKGDGELLGRRTERQAGEETGAARSRKAKEAAPALVEEHEREDGAKRSRAVRKVLEVQVRIVD